MNLQFRIWIWPVIGGMRGGRVCCGGMEMEISNARLKYTNKFKNPSKFVSIQKDQKNHCILTIQDLHIQACQKYKMIFPEESCFCLDF